MKKTIFLTTLAFLFFSIILKAQSNLSQLITDENGLSKKFVRIDEPNQFKFSLNQINNLLALPAKAALYLTDSSKDNLGFINYRFVETYSGIPIENTMYIISVKNEMIKGLNGCIIVKFDEAKMTVSNNYRGSDAAFEAAKKECNAQSYAWQNQEMESSLKKQFNDVKASYKQKPTLVWYNIGDEVNQHNLILCYKVDLYSIQPLNRADYFINAQTGFFVGKKNKLEFTDAIGNAQTAYSGVQVIHSDMTAANNYRLRDITKGNGIVTLHGEGGQRGNEYTNNSPNWALGGTSIAALDAHYGVSQTYAFYFANFGRNSYDNHGTALTSYVNDPTYSDNAFWDGTAMNFCGRSNGALGGTTGIDVTGHELTHGVTQATSGLNYSNESGAINESISDIMGKCVQFWSKPTDVNWSISNDMGWIIRNMANPNAQSQPDTYGGTFWYTGSSDNGGVHTNSGVGNFMFYLLANGGTGTNDKGYYYAVQCIGIAHAQQIIYRAETVYLTPTSNYSIWRTACINAATDLYGANSNEVLQVQNAWYAVGVGTLPNNITGSTLVCTSNVYSIPITNGSIVTWTATPQGIVNILSNGNQATVSKLTDGIVILKALVTSSCGTYDYYYTIGVGFPRPTISIALNCPDGTASANGMPPGTGNTFTWHLVDATTHQETIYRNYGSTINFRNLIGTHNIGAEYSDACGTSPSGVIYNVYCPGGGHIVNSSNTESSTSSKFSNVVVYPNPAKDNLMIDLRNSDFKNSGGKINVKIIDELGNVVKSFSFKNAGNKISIPLEKISQGSYFISISDDQKVITQKVNILR